MDSDIEHLSKKRGTDASSKTESNCSSNSSSEKLSSDLLRRDSASANGVKCEDVNSCAESTTQLPDETHLAESEQATHASANNDLKGTKACQEADVPGLYNLAMAIIDYRGHRVVAQVCV